MRELDRHAADRTMAAAHDPEAPGELDVQDKPPRDPGPRAPAARSVAVVGRGRAGSALARALADAGLTVHGPSGRGEPVAASANGSTRAPDAVLLCVPDADIPSAARAAAGVARLVGHTSGATPLSALAPAARAGAELFGLHPLQTLTGEESAPRLAGSACAVAGSSPEALLAARRLAERLGLEPFEITDANRPAYHAAASIASNFLVTLQDAAEGIAGGAGMTPAEARRALLPLVRATVESWGVLGPERALTGPVARGDEDTVAAHRAVVECADPALLPLFEALVQRTRQLAARGEGDGDPPAATSDTNSDAGRHS